MTNNVFPDSTGETMNLADYHAAFEKDFVRSGPAGFWKLEARQTFLEPRSASWRTFNAGGLGEAVRMHEDRRPELERRHARMIQQGSTNQRVRLVVTPLTRYLLWELPLLRMRDEVGMRTHVINLVDRPDLGGPADWPEVVVCGEVAAYEVLYDASGLDIGGIRHTDRDVIAHWRDRIADLVQLGEPIHAFYKREVAPLLPA